MTPWCVLICNWRRQLADRHLLPLAWTLSLRRRWCPSASHHPVSFLSFLGLGGRLCYHHVLLSLHLSMAKEPRGLVTCAFRGGGGGLPLLALPASPPPSPHPALSGPPLGYSIATLGPCVKVAWCLLDHWRERVRAQHHKMLHARSMKTIATSNPCHKGTHGTPAMHSSETGLPSVRV